MYVQIGYCTWNVVSWDQIPVDVNVRGREVRLLRAGHDHGAHSVGVRVNLVKETGQL